jgi:uncharacterized coiled-coil protein SlyX
MLVGDHGRIIPFRRFKGIAIGVVASLILAVLVIVGLSVAYMWQAEKIDQLNAALKKTNQQMAKLRDEKDLLLAKMVVTNKQPIRERENQPPSTDDSTAQKAEKAAVPPAPAADTPQTTASGKPAQQEQEKQEKKTPEKEKPVLPVQLNADVRRFSADYQITASLLKCAFRIYNTSKPKHTLAGRSVVVFKNIDEPPIKWLAVPRVQLIDGVPNGKLGKSFKINNYRTMTFKAYGLKPPLRYNTASVYVYSSDGKLLLNREIPINIDVPVPAPPKPAPAEPPAAQPSPAQESRTTQDRSTVTPTPPTPPSPSPTGTPAPATTDRRPGQDGPTESSAPDALGRQPHDPSTESRPSTAPPAESLDGNATESPTVQHPEPPEKPKTEGESQ